MTDKITKEILGLTVNMQFAGKEYEIDGKKGITKESLSIQQGKGFVKLTALQLKGIMNLQNDTEFMKEIEKRATVDQKNLNTILGLNKK